MNAYPLFITHVTRRGSGVQSHTSALWRVSRQVCGMNLIASTPAEAWG